MPGNTLLFSNAKVNVSPFGTVSGLLAAPGRSRQCAGEQEDEAGEGGGAWGGGVDPVWRLGGERSARGNSILAIR